MDTKAIFSLISRKQGIMAAFKKSQGRTNMRGGQKGVSGVHRWEGWHREDGLGKEGNKRKAMKSINRDGGQVVRIGEGGEGGKDKPQTTDKKRQTYK